MMIPKGAANNYTAELMMNYVLRPEGRRPDRRVRLLRLAGQGRRRRRSRRLDPDAATNPLLFPTADVVAKQHNFQSLSDDIETTLNDLFSKLSGAEPGSPVT